MHAFQRAAIRQHPRTTPHLQGLRSRRSSPPCEGLHAQHVRPNQCCLHGLRARCNSLRVQQWSQTLPWQQPYLWYRSRTCRCKIMITVSQPGFWFICSSLLAPWHCRLPWNCLGCCAHESKWREYFYLRLGLFSNGMTHKAGGTPVCRSVAAFCFFRLRPPSSQACSCWL